MKAYENISLVKLKVNGETRDVAIRPADTLLRVLREKLGLTAAKPGCENGDCGACTVLINEKPVKSCMKLAVEVDAGAEIITLEGIKNSIIQETFLEEDGFQCGYCTPGFLVNAYALLKEHPDADDKLAKEWLESNICRCTGYEGIRNALKLAQEKLK